MRNIGIVPNFKKEIARKITDDMIIWLKDRNVGALMIHEHAILSRHSELGRFEKELTSLIDCLIVLGGDGTLLSTARMFASSPVPILGVNLGKLGFLTEIEIPDLFDGLEKLISGQYKIDERMMLSTQLVREGRVIEHFNSLNDTVITKGVLARMITVSVYVDERYVDTYSADGIILSTPTGSTAYSLSAGGPIVYPKVEVILLTPICPHTLYARSLVLPESGIIRLVINGDHNETMLTIDGQYGYNLMPGDEIIVKKSEYVTKLIRLSGRNFFDVLQQKLKGG